MTFLRSLEIKRTRITIALILLVLFSFVVTTYGNWTVGSDPGNGRVQATTPKNLTLADTTISTITPGGTASLILSVTNPNDFSVTLTDVAGAGTITADKPGCAATSVTYTAQSGLTQVIAAGATATVTLPGSVSMSTGAANACKGAIFVIPVSLVASN